MDMGKREDVKNMPKLYYFKLILVLLLFFSFGCKSNQNNNFTIKAEVKTVKDKLFVTGETNLPNKAQLLVSVKSKKTKKIVVQGLPFVEDGKFESSLILNRVKKGRYEIRIEFSPEAYDWSKDKIVTKTVGIKGENLKGPDVKKRANGTRILEKLIDFKY